MTGRRVAIRVPVGRPLPDIAAFVARCEDAGFDGVGIHDHPSSGRDAYLALALAARSTDRLQLFPATSSPDGSASTGSRLARPQSGGNCTGTYMPAQWRPASFRRGASGSRVPVWRSCARRSAISVACSPGKRSRSVQHATRLRNRSATPTPVYLLAAGPRMIELAGEVADGALLMVGLHPASVRAALRHLEAGARRAGRSLADFPVVFVVTLGLGTRCRGGARWVRSWFAPGQPFLAYPSIANLRWLREAGFDDCGRARSCCHPGGSRTPDCRCVRPVRLAGALRRSTAACA